MEPDIFNLVFDIPSSVGVGRVLTKPDGECTKLVYDCVFYPEKQPEEKNDAIE